MTLVTSSSINKAIQDSTIGPKWKYLNKSNQIHKWKLERVNKPTKDPLQADINHTFMRMDERVIEFAGELGIKE